MIDPLSLTLAAITLATALKDMLELAQKLNDSFKQHALNEQEAKSLAQETLEIVQNIKRFYGQHEKALDDDLYLRESVIDLLRDMKLVYEECLSILDSGRTSKTKLHLKIKYSIDTWKRRKLVERQIRTLKEQASKCYRRFTISTQLDSAAGVVHLRGAVTGMAKDFAAIQQQYLPQIWDESALAFMGPAPIVLSKLPPHIQLSEHLVYRSYITLQVGRIEALFKNVASRGSYSLEEPDPSHLLPFRPIMYFKPSINDAIEDVQSNVFALMVEIQENMKRRDDQISIQRGANAMSRLSNSLSKLGMAEESLTIVQYAVDAYSTLVKTNENVYGPHLAHALRLMSSCYVKTGNVVEAYKAIAAAVTVGRRLADASSTFDAQIQLSGLISFSAYVAGLNGDSTNALKDAEEAVQNYQRLIGEPTSILQAEVEIVEGAQMTLEGTYVHEYANALIELHNTLSSSRKIESVKAGIEALESFRALEQRHKSGAFSNRISIVCFSLASNKFGEIIPIDHALLYARESIQHYEKMLQNTGVVPDNLPDALGLEAELLSSLERFHEAHAVCKKIEWMIQTQMDSQHLRARSFLQLIQNLFDSKHYAEAALTGEQFLFRYQSSLSDWELYNAYHYTSVAFAWIGDYCKSIQVMEASVNHWRMLALKDPAYQQHVVKSIFTLMLRYFWAENYEQAANRGEEVLKLYSKLITGPSGTTFVRDYMEALQLNVKVARRTEKEFQSLERSRLVLHYSRTLVEQFPLLSRLFLVRRIRDHAILLEDFDHLTDASATISQAIHWFDDHPTHDSESVELHTHCLVDSARLLCLQGHPDRALSVYDNAMTIGQPFLDAYPVAWNILWLKAINLFALYVMGRVSIALDEIDACLAFTSEHNLEQGFAYTFCLKTISRLYRCAGRVTDALIIIRRSIALDREDAETPSSWILSDLLADAGLETEALDVAHKAVLEMEKSRNSFSTLDKAFYVQAQYSLALRLFANGDFFNARELLAQVRSFYQHHSKASLGFINLAIALWALSQLEYASGRHEKGMAARTELNELRKRLRLEFSSLADLVEVGLNRERNFAAWKRLLERYNLSCGDQHEDEISEGNTQTPLES